MKIRTKLLTAVLATATALSCALTASALTTTLNLQGNETAPAKVDAAGNATATLTLKASAFKEVKGAKITVELPAGLKLSDITVTDTENTWKLDEDSNYKVDLVGNKITMVDVFNFDDTVNKDNLNLNLTFDVAKASIGTYEVKVSGDFADETADKVYKSNGTGNLVINRAVANPQDLSALNAMTNDSGYFIPYGGASIGNDSLIKNGEGKFELPAGLQDGAIDVLKCKLPAEGKNVTTFAISPHKTDTASIQFGSYAPNTNSLKYGTFVIIGDYQAFKDAKANNLTDEEVLQKFGKLYKKTILDKDKDENNYMRISYGADYILVGRKSQTKYMWQGNSNQLQYALRMTGISGDYTNKTFTAVGYSLANDTTYNFSAEMQSTTLSKLYPEANN